MKKSVFTILLLLAVGFSVSAQNISFSARLQNDSIIVGEQTLISISAEIPPQTQVTAQQFADTICDKIFLIKDLEAKVENGKYTKDYLITSFDTGINAISPIRFMTISGSDTNEFTTSELYLKVNPYILIDTIPRDTVFAENAGTVLFGKDGFSKEIEQYIPDSIKQSMSADTLQMLREEIKRQMIQQYASQVMQTGFTNQQQIDSIANADSHRMFVVDKDIMETHYVYGSVDSVFVQEGQQVAKGDILFTLFEIEDINDELYNTPFNWAEFWYDVKAFFSKFWWLILIVLVAGAIIFYVIYRKKHGKSPIPMIKVKPKRPAHETALEELERIRNEKIWSRGQVKEYHVQLTDAVRTYIADRYGIDAEQMTTSEILDMFGAAIQIDSEDKMRLRQMLELADSVKFAKFQPLQSDNDLSLRNAFEFVEHTKEIIVNDPKAINVQAEIEADKVVTQEENEKQE
ncbi:MAG: biotin/lipoyl-binding protein [Bacteroidales bacterium]|nr:biotin/lipoyl-binding protein [Bacteroidales bacterium]